MKKLIGTFLTLIFILSFAGCSNRQTQFDIKIIVPAGSTDEFVYSETEISPLKDALTISSGDGLGDTEVLLKTIKVKEKTAYSPTYLTKGMPVDMKVEKGAWFKIGVNMQNATDKDIVVYINVRDVDVRIE